MARLSDSLISAMTKPSYSGMLSKSIMDTSEGITGAFADKRSRQAEEAAQAILTQGDVSDPRVQQSVQAIYAQMNQDPGKAAELIKAQQVEARAQSAEQRAKESHVQQKAYAELQMTKAKQAEQEKKMRAVALGKYQAGQKPEDILASLPEEYREEAMQAIQNQDKFVTGMEEYRQAAKDKEPFSQETIDAIAKTPGMEASIEAYNSMLKDNPVAAKRILLKQWETAHNGSIRAKPQAKNLSPTTVNRYVKFIQDLDLKPVGLNPATWGNIGKGTGIPPELVQAVAVEMARRERDDEYFDPTPDTVQSIINDLTGQAADAETGEEEKSSGRKRGPQGKKGSTLTVPDQKEVSEFDSLSAKFKQVGAKGMTDEEKRRLYELGKQQGI